MIISKRQFENIRITIYVVFFVTGILQCVLPMKYLCDNENVSCFLCGMRHAVDYLLAFEIKKAYVSNPLILSGFLILIDTFFIFIKRLSFKFKK